MSLSKEDIEAYIKLRGYGKPISVRGFQRLMNYNSPGKAQRVLARLERHGFIEKTSSNEYIARENLPPPLAMYIVIKGYLIPRIFVYAIYVTTTVIVYMILVNPPIYLFLLLVALILPYWIETIKTVNILKILLRE